MNSMEHFPIVSNTKGGNNGKREKGENAYSCRKNPSSSHYFRVNRSRHRRISNELRIVPRNYVCRPDNEVKLYPPSSAWRAIKELPNTRRWKHAFLISCIRKASASKSSRKTKQEPEPIYSDFLGTMLGERYYKKIVDEAIELGLIEQIQGERYFSHGSGEYGCTPNRFSIKEEHCTDSVCLVLINQSLVRKLAKRRNEETERSIGGNPSRRWIAETLLRHTSIDWDEAIQAFNAEVPDPKKRQKDNFEINLARIASGDMSFRRDSKTGRLNHTVAMFSKIGRPYILIDGELTDETDIGSSQVSLSTLLYPFESLEKKCFIKILTEENFYWYIERFSEYKYAKEDYGKLKGDFFGQVFYCKIGHEWEKPLWDSYDRIFPEHAALVYGEKELGNREFALKMQRIEADLMVNRVVDRLRRESIRCLTVHDSLICKKRDTERVRQVLSEELMGLLGFIPRIETKDRYSL